MCASSAHQRSGPAIGAGRGAAAGRLPGDAEAGVAEGGAARADASDGVVYVTRKFPPSTGGMELLAVQLHRAMRAHGSPHLVALGRAQRHLWWFLPWALVRVIALVAGRRVRRVVCGDPVVLLALLPVATLLRIPTTVVVHGLDLTWSAPGYGRLARWAARRADRVVAISEATRRVAAELGVRRDRLSVLRPGLPVPAVDDAVRERARARIVAALDLPPDALVLATVGRLVPRKGVGWFVRDVLPELPGPVAYLVLGSGPEQGAVEAVVRERGLEDRVRILGRVSDEERDRVLSAADVFVMPNVSVPGDMEGFGLVALEAAMAGALVVATRLEGIRDAVIDGVTGYLCAPGDGAELVERIAALAADRELLSETAARFREEACARYSFDRLVDDLPEALGLEPT